MQWMPDVIPFEQYVYQAGIYNSLPHPAILSPPTKVLHPESVYGDNGTADEHSSPRFTHSNRGEDLRHIYDIYYNKHYHSCSTFSRWHSLLCKFVNMNVHEFLGMYEVGVLNLFLALTSCIKKFFLTDLLGIFMLFPKFLHIISN